MQTKKRAKNFIVVLLFVLSIFPSVLVHAETRISNIGFIPENIWYSKDPFEEGDKIKIYTLLFNPDSRELSGTVSFFDKDVLLGKKEFTLNAKQVKDISIDWTATVGAHTISAKIENPKFLISPGKYESAYLVNSETDKSSRTVYKKIVPTIEDIKDAVVEKTLEKTTAPINNIQAKILEKTPEFISKPIIATVETLENFRDTNAVSANEKKQEFKQEVAVLNTPKETTTAGTDTVANPSKFEIQKPFTYAKLFFMTLVTLILEQKVLFYGILLIIIAIIFRFIWRKIF